LVNWGDGDKIARISVIDWEFVMMAPTFVDVGNFVRELFLNNHFESRDFSYVIMLESFITAYTSVGTSLSIQDVLGFAGARSMWSLARRVKSPTRVEHLEHVPSCVNQALKLIMGSSPNDREHGPVNPLQGLVSLMRERAMYNKTSTELGSTS
jgi:hypothetical protein